MALLRRLKLARRAMIAVFVASTAVISSPVQAEVDDIYTVRGVPVDAQAEEAAEARIIAIRQGRQMALRLLFQRLTMPVDWSVLPVLQSSEVTAMGAGFEVADERNSPTRYLAKMTYRFKPDEVRRVLREFDVPFSESQARKLVVLPVFEAPGQVSLWEEENLWRQAWDERNYVNELVPLITPLGDLSDVLSTPIESVQNNDFAGLTGYAARYGVRDILIVRLKQIGEFQPLKAEAIRLTATRTEGFQVTLPASDDVGSSMQFAIDQIVKRLQHDWKAKTIIRYGDQRPMTVSARFNTVGEWMLIRQAMAATPAVVDSDLIAMSTDGAQMQWSVVGSPDQLALSLMQHNVVLSPGDPKPTAFGPTQAMSPAQPTTQEFDIPGELPTTSSVRDQMGPVISAQDSVGGGSTFYGVGSQPTTYIPANADPAFWVIRYQPEVGYNPFMDEEDETFADEEEDPFADTMREEDLEPDEDEQPSSDF